MNEDVRRLAVLAQVTNEATPERDHGGVAQTDGSPRTPLAAFADDLRREDALRDVRRCGAEMIRLEPTARSRPISISVLRPNPAWTVALPRRRRPRRSRSGACPSRSAGGCLAEACGVAVAVEVVQRSTGKPLRRASDVFRTRTARSAARHARPRPRPDSSTQRVGESSRTSAMCRRRAESVRAPSGGGSNGRGHLTTAQGRSSTSPSSRSSRSEDGYGYDVVRRLRGAGLEDVGDASGLRDAAPPLRRRPSDVVCRPERRGPHRKYYALNTRGPRHAARLGAAVPMPFTETMTKLLDGAGRAA